jgi:DNA repair exonuclease SbcCD ATPase subunit
MTMLSTAEPGIGSNSGNDGEALTPSSSGDFDILADLRQELEQLSAANRAIFEELQSDTSVDVEGAATTEADAGSPAPRFAPVTCDADWVERQREYEALLEEKSETIRTLNLRVQQLEEGAAPPLSEVEIHDAAVLRMKAALEDQRRQLEEDEEALMRQMREMELALARDRADLARQRAELQRQQTDFQRELEGAARDPNLRERLISMQRRHGDAQGKRSADRSAERPLEPVAAVASVPVPVPPEPPRPKSSIIRRIFG